MSASQSSSMIAQNQVNPWFAVAAVAFGGFTSLLSSTTIEVAFSNLMATFGMSMATAQWTITLYMIIMTIAMLLAADTVKRIGIRNTSSISFVLFMLGCWVAGTSETTTQLFIGRILQGFAAGLQTPIAAIVVTKTFPKERIGFAMGIFGSVMLLAPALGPVIGGFIVDQHDWRMLFYFQIPLAIISLVLGIIALPKGELSASGKYDWSGLLLITVFISSLFAAMSLYDNSDNNNNPIWLYSCVLATVIALSAFIYNEKSALNPLVDLKIFSITPFSINLIVIFAFGAGMFSSILLIPFYLIETLNYSPAEAGMALLPAGLSMVITSPIAGRLADKFSPPYIIIPSMLVFAASGYYLSNIEAGPMLTHAIIGALLTRLGLSFLLPSLYATTIKQLNGQFTEYGSSLMNFARQLGSAMGVFIFSSLFTSLALEHIAAQNSAQTLVQHTEQLKQLAEHQAFVTIFNYVGHGSIACVFLWFISYKLGAQSPQSSHKRQK